MNKAYSRINWENEPSLNTPINETNLNRMDGALNEVDDRIISVDAAKASKQEVATTITNVSLNENTGVLTFTRKNGTTFTIDTVLEKIAINFDYDETNQTLIIYLEDGTQKIVDMSALITQLEFLNTDTISATIDGQGKVILNVIDGSITANKLNPDYLANITVQVQTATKAATDAEQYKNIATNQAAIATEKANIATEKATEANESADTATSKATEASTSARNALNSETNAKTSETNAKASENKAKISENNSKNSEINAKTSEDNAKESENNALVSEQNALASENNAKSSELQAEGFKQQAQDAVATVNQKLGLAEFDVDEEGNLIYTENTTGYTFTVDNDGNLNYQVA